MGALRRVGSVEIHRDYQRTAQVASLLYVNSSTKGIRREKKGNAFVFTLDGKKISDPKTLDRIKKLVIPPAWTNVWICPKTNGHIQATGFDVRGRKQYKYHQEWNSIRNETKFLQLYEFGKALPLLRKRVKKDLSSHELTREKVLATVVRLMEQTLIRVGNNEYEKLYGSYGLTTLKDNHVNINGTQIKFSFKGKKGVYHTISIRNKRLARIVKACRDIPGKELFQFLNDDGTRSSIDSGMVNAYIQETMGNGFSAKDFRTWAGTLAFLNCLNQCGDIDVKKNIVKAIDDVSAKLGNTRAICRKYYVHPKIISLYDEGKLSKYLADLKDSDINEETVDLSHDEKVLMKILKAL